jgi:hypothetical protein
LWFLFCSPDYAIRREQQFDGCGVTIAGQRRTLNGLASETYYIPILVFVFVFWPFLT